MKALSVIELANLYGMNRQSTYKRINKGDLTKNSDGKIDLAEAIRVFGEPSQRSNPNVTTLQPPTVQKSAEVDILKQQVDMLQKQLEIAQEREQFQREQLKAKDDQIYSLQLLLGAPKPQQPAESAESSSEPKPEPIPTEITSTPKPEPMINTEILEPKRRSIFNRLERAVRTVLEK